MRALLVALAACLACLPASAAALPGDPPPAPLTPDDGAALPVDPGGIPVSYLCPVYRISLIGEFTQFGGRADYTVGLAASPEVGADGRLIARVATAGGTDVGWSQSGDVCTGRLGAGGATGTTPQETPGTYFWQVWRLCLGCEGSSYEVGPVRRLELRSTAAPAFGPLRTAYAGYPVAVPLALPGVPSGTTATVERRVASGSWRPVGSATAVGEAGTAAVTFDRPGTETIRVAVRVGAQSVTSGERAVRVRPGASRAVTTRRDEGAYVDTGRGVESLALSLRATARGRELRGVRALVPMTCPGVTAGQFTTQIGTFAIPKIRIAPDGRFVAARAPGGATALFISGRLKSRRISEGVISMSLGPCTATRTFTARRK